jgi:hypothetical protein
MSKMMPNHAICFFMPPSPHSLPELQHLIPQVFEGPFSKLMPTTKEWFV